MHTHPPPMPLHPTPRARHDGEQLSLLDDGPAVATSCRPTTDAGAVPRARALPVRDDDGEHRLAAARERADRTLPTVPLESYSRFVVASSGGKDSLRAFVWLLDQGVELARIEWLHHLVDGREGSTLMDWECGSAYVRAIAGSFGVPVYESWRVGGFEGEMLRDRAHTRPVRFETPDGVQSAGGDRGTCSTRLRFPQVAASLSVRWCSAVLKIDVADAVIRNQRRFEGTRTLFVTGERAEESPGRARYAVLEPHRADARHGRKRRHVDHVRPCLGLTEREVWDGLRRWGIVPPPAYFLQFARWSCQACIFGNADQWASVRAISPDRFARIAAYETRFGRTIHRVRSVVELADAGRVYPAIAAHPEWVARARARGAYTGPVRCAPDAWVLPAGAFGDSCGPS